MAHVQVQYRRKLTGAPVIGKWQVYSAAWFSVANTTPSAAVLLGLQRLFLGQNWLGTGQIWTNSNVFDLSAGAGLITVHEWVGGAKVKVADHTVTVPTITTVGTNTLPAQCQVTVGYRSTAGVNTRLGRSRFFIGPLNLGNTMQQQSPSGGSRLTASAVGFVRDNAVAAVAGLTAAGWQLVVSSGRPDRTFSPALELYVDDVFDIQRSRRAWVVEQRRSAL